MADKSINFKDEYTFEERLAEAKKILSKYSNRVPIIVEPYKGGYFSRTSNIEIDKKKYLVPNSLTLGQFMHIIRKRINLQEHEAIFCFFGKGETIPPMSALMGDVYEQYKDDCLFLYAKICKEETFG